MPGWETASVGNLKQVDDPRGAVTKIILAIGHGVNWKRRTETRDNSQETGAPIRVSDKDVPSLAWNLIPELSPADLPAPAAATPGVPGVPAQMHLSSGCPRVPC